MPFLRYYKFSCMNCLFAGALILSLTSCSGGDGGLAGDASTTTTTFGDLNLSWIAPDQREDGSVFVPSLELAEYRVYYGSEPGDYQNQIDIVGGFTDASAPSIPSGVYYVVVTAVDKQGRESLYSSEVVITI